MSSIFRDIIISYLEYLKDWQQYADQKSFLATLLLDEFKYVCEPIPSDTAHTASNETVMTMDTLTALLASYNNMKKDSLFIRFEETIASMGYFHGHLNKEKLGKYADCLTYFETKIKDKNLAEADFQVLLVALIEEERKASGCTQSMDQVLLSSTMWDDLNVALLKPAKQVTVDNTTSARDRKMAMIKELLETKAKHGPNIKYTFALFSVSFASIVLVALSTTVRESPYLFRVLWALAYAINAVTVSIPGTAFCFYFAPASALFSVFFGWWIPDHTFCGHN